MPAMDKVTNGMMVHSRAEYPSKEVRSSDVIVMTMRHVLSSFV